MKALIWKKPIGPSLEASSIINPPLKLAIAGLFFLGSWTAIWGVFSRVPVEVTGTGILVPSEGLMDVKSPGTGTVLFPFMSRDLVSVRGDKMNSNRIVFNPPAWSERAYDFQWGVSPEVKTSQQAIALAESIVKTLNSAGWARIDSRTRGVNLQEKYGGNISVKKKDLVALVDNGSQRKSLITALNRYNQSQTVATNNQASLRLDLEDGIRLYSTMVERYEANLPLLEAGAISKEQILSLKTDFINQQARINDFRRQIEANRETAEKAKDNLMVAVTDYLQASAVYANENARITSFQIGQRSSVQPGTPLMLLGWEKELSPNEIPIFLDERAYAQVGPGMEAIVTPIGFSASEIGGIRGIVTSIETLPLSTESISRLITGLGGASLVQGGTSSIYLATVELLTVDSTEFNDQISRFRSQVDTDRTGGYIWNNRSKPPKPPREGVLLDVQVTTREMSPLEMLLPNLRELTGLSTPQRFTDLQNQNPNFD